MWTLTLPAVPEDNRRQWVQTLPAVILTNRRQYEWPHCWRFLRITAGSYFVLPAVILKNRRQYPKAYIYHPESILGENRAAHFAHLTVKSKGGGYFCKNREGRFFFRILWRWRLPRVCELYPLLQFLVSINICSQFLLSSEIYICRVCGNLECYFCFHLRQMLLDVVYPHEFNFKFCRSTW